MKAVAFRKHLPIDALDALIDIELTMPVAKGRDLLVEVKAISVNPVDVKVRRGKGTEPDEEPPRVIGWDASGIVTAVGSDVSLFKPGDAVYYAGDLTRSGCNAQFQLVDERIVGHKPKSISHAEAAALPLTSITAYESLFDRLHIDRDGGNRGESVLIIGGAGGVGSIGIQLAKLAGLKVIATASRPETIAWVEDLGAHHTVNHHGDLVAQVRALGFQSVDHIAIFNDMRHWNAAVELVGPQGGIVTIDDANLPMPMGNMKTKSASLHWEFMFTRAMHKTPDMIKQHQLQNWVAGEIDGGRIRSTLSKVISPVTAANLREAHRMVEAGSMRGKVVLEGW